MNNENNSAEKSVVELQQDAIVQAGNEETLEESPRFNAVMMEICGGYAARAEKASSIK